jgi:hypothetical protein
LEVDRVVSLLLLAVEALGVVLSNRVRVGGRIVNAQYEGRDRSADLDTGLVADGSVGCEEWTLKHR